MAKKAIAVPEVSLHSLTDAGFQQGKNTSALESIVRFVMSRVPTLGDPSVDRADQIDKESKEDLRKGYMSYYAASLKPNRYFLIVDNNLVEKQHAEWSETTGYEKREFGVHIAFGFTQATLNDMKETNPDYYRMVMDLKTEFNAYVSNRLGDLIRKAKEIHAENMGLKRERVPTKVFSVWEDETLKLILQRVKTADSRGNDPSADVERVKRAIAAHLAVK